MTLMSAIPARCVIPLPGGVEMAFRLLPAGEFLMGSRGYEAAEEPVHRVIIAEPFWMAETPVTQAQFAVWTKAKGIGHQNRFAGHPDHPAENMDWHQSVVFAEWLSRTCAASLPPGYPCATLPSEAQWEYACRAGTPTEYHTGDGEPALMEAGWFGEDWEKGSTHPVRQKIPNAFHLFDMHGNVWEWCADVWDARAYRKRPSPWQAKVWDLTVAGDDAEYLGDSDRSSNNPDRVMRGGSWCHSAWGCRSAFRFGWGPGDRFGYLGFRMALVPGSGGGQQQILLAVRDIDRGGRGTRPESEGAVDLSAATLSKPPA